MKFNDLNLSNWKELDINVDSLWIISSRDRSGKHKNIYHGNFIPQIPNQLIRRFTKKEEIVLDPFLGSGTTLFECERLNRQFIGFDINNEILYYVKNQIKMSLFPYDDYYIDLCDVSDLEQFENKIKKGLNVFKKKFVDFCIVHPPYLDIIKFTNNPKDLSNITNIEKFREKFLNVIKVTYSYLENKRYFAIVIGDIYKFSEVVPLSYYLMEDVRNNFKVKLKGIIIKNIEGNKGKLGKQNIWKYRALRSDYFIFKHEYIFVFKKES